MLEQNIANCPIYDACPCLLHQAITSMGRLYLKSILILEIHGQVKLDISCCCRSNPDANDIYSGLIPISPAKNETRKLFFWFFPSKDAKHTDDLM